MRHLLSFSLAVSMLFLCGWPDLDLNKLGREAITSTGVVTNSQLDAAIKAGEKLDQASGTLSQEQEYYLGRGVSAMILRQFPLYRGNAGLTQHLNLVGSALAAKSSRPEIFGGYHFAIIDTEQINALSAPAGFVFVSRGFLSIIPDEEALAAVLAHEIAHVVLGHGRKAISQANLSAAAMIIGKEAASSYAPSELTTLTDAFSVSVDQVFDTIVKSGYSRSQEYEADQFAAELLVKTGYSAKGLSTMLNALSKNGGKERGGWSDTHPSPADRIQALSIPKQSVDPKFVELRTARYKAAESPAAGVSQLIGKLFQGQQPSN